MRLQVFLSRNGVCSRRKAFDVIKEGRVFVNNKRISEPSFDVDPTEDKVIFEGKLIDPKSYEYILLNKPAGYVTTKSDKFAKKTVYDILPRKYHHLSPVGRLDKDTEGLLIFTNDGDFANQLTHPSFNINKEYLVRIPGVLSKIQKRKLEKGIIIDGSKTSPARIIKLRKLKDMTEFCLIIHEGKKRQVRRMLEAVGSKVIYLKRIKQGRYSLGDLTLGKWKKIDKK